MLQSLSSLHAPLELRGRSVPNRIVAQPMEINAASADGSVSEALRRRYLALARGGWGIIFLEAISIAREGLARKNGLVLNKSTASGLASLIAGIRGINPHTLVFAQITHAGRLCAEPSQRVKAYDDGSDARLLGRGEIESIRDSFIESAALCARAGFDGVDIKACHGYLGGEILRPQNTRPDEYGGVAENRARFLATILEALRRGLPELIVGSRISLYEGIRGGCGTASPDEAIEELGDMMEMLARLVDAGADFINVSAGIPSQTPLLTRPVKGNSFEAYHHFRYARLVKERFPGIAVIGSAYSAGGEEGAVWAEENIARGSVDLAGFGRQSLADPLFPEKLRGNPASINYCTLCAGCSRLLAAQKRVRCVVYDESEGESGDGA